MSDSKEAARRWFEAFSRHDLDALAEMTSKDLVHHNSTNQGRDGVVAEALYWFAAFPDASVSIEDMIGEGDRVAVRIRATATHEGEFFGAPPTSRRVDVQEMHMVRVESGQVAEMWSAPDFYGLLTQLGMIPVGDDEEIA